MEPTSDRLAICCVRTDLTTDRERDVRLMCELGERLGRVVVGPPIDLEPLACGIFTTIRLALRTTGATAVIVLDFDQLNGALHAIREHAELITVEGERVLGRAFMRPSEAL